MTNPIQAAEVRAERVEWLWRDRIPRGAISIVAGRSDQGKGLLCAHIASDITRTRMPDGEFGQVLYSAMEDSHGLMTRPRLEAAGANLKNVHLWRFQIPAMQAELEAIVREKDIDLIVIDPMAAHLSHGISRHSDNIRSVLNPLTKLVEETGTAVIIVEHVLKRVPRTGDPKAAIGGSGSGIVAACRMGFLFGVDPDDEDHRLLCCIKNNIRERPKALGFELDTIPIAGVGEVPALVYQEECNFDPLRMLSAEGSRGKVGRPPDKRAAACEWLTNYLYKAGGPVRSAIIIEDAKQHGMTYRTLRRAADDMEVIKSAGGGAQTTWDLPKEIKDLMDAAHASRKQQVISDDDLEAMFDDD